MTPTKKTTTKKLFTLLEVMIALVILSLVGAFSITQIKTLVSSHRFEKQVFNLFSALQEAQILAATFQTDIALDFFKKGESFYYRFSTFEPFSKHQFNDQEIAMPHLAALKFKEKSDLSLHFDIYSEGRIEPRGILEFCRSEKDSKALWFDLQYGQLIKFTSKKPAKFTSNIPQKPDVTDRS